MSDLSDKINYQDLARWDIVQESAPLLNNGYFIDVNTHKITCNDGYGWDTPWIYLGSRKNKEVENCRQRKLTFDTFGTFPEGCLDCWKVFIKPITVRGLFNTYDVLCRLDYPGKCGIDLRDYTPHTYLGVVYCRGREQGDERYETVRAEITKELGKDTEVFLKPYCTELQQKFGSSYQRKDLTEDDLGWDELVKKHFDLMEGQLNPPQIVKNHVMRFWLAWAWADEDKSAMVYNDGKPLTEPQRHQKKGE